MDVLIRIKNATNCTIYPISTHSVRSMNVLTLSQLILILNNPIHILNNPIHIPNK